MVHDAVSGERAQILDTAGAGTGIGIQLTREGIGFGLSIAKKVGIRISTAFTLALDYEETVQVESSQGGTWFNGELLDASCSLVSTKDGTTNKTQNTKTSQVSIWVLSINHVSIPIPRLLSPIFFFLLSTPPTPKDETPTQTTTMKLSVATLLLAAGTGVPSVLSQSDEPTNLHELECNLHTLAYHFGTARVPDAADSLYKALNLDNCSSSDTAVAFSGNDRFAPVDDRAVARDMKSAKLQSEIAHAEVLESILRNIHAESGFYVSTTGSDDNDGSKSKPFATLGRAQQAAAQAKKPAAVFIEPGKYFVEATLKLGADDSQVTWAATQPTGVVLSGGKPLSGCVRACVRA